MSRLIFRGKRRPRLLPRSSTPPTGRAWRLGRLRRASGMGRMIVERPSAAKHGLAIAEQLAADRRSEFLGTAGFSRPNLFYIRQFFQSFRDDTKVQPLVAPIARSHNLCKKRNAPNATRLQWASTVRVRKAGLRRGRSFVESSLLLPIPISSVSKQRCRLRCPSREGCGSCSTEGLRVLG